MNYIIVYLEIEHLLNFLTQEEKGDFLDLLICYGKDQKQPAIQNQKLLNVFNFIKGRLDTQFEKARLKAETARKNGAGGGRPKKDKKPNRNPRKPIETQSVYLDLINDLKLILEAKLKKQISTKGWEKDFQLLIEKDLKERENPVEDVKKAIQAISDYFTEQYFPVVQSSNSLRSKFSKIEAFLGRKLSSHISEEKNTINKWLENF